MSEKDNNYKQRSIDALKIINSTPCVIFLWQNKEGWPVEFVSENVLKVFGYTAEDFTSGKISYDKVIHPDDLERVALEVAKYSSEKDRKNFAHQPYRIITKDGLVKWVDDRTEIIRDAEGNITHYQGIVLDITYLTKMHLALARSEHKFHTIFDHGTDGILVADIATKKFIMANPKICQMLGYTEEELLKLSLMDIHPPESIDFVLNTFQKQAKGEFTLAKDIPVKRKDGSVFYADIDTTCLVLDGKECMMGFFRDISDRKNAEEMLRDYSRNLEKMVEERTQELVEMHNKLLKQEHMAMLGKLAGGVGHELRNPLGVIKNVAYFLNMAINDRDPDVLKSLELLDKNVAACERIINSLLHFARPRQPVVMRVDLNSIILEALSRTMIPDSIIVEKKLSPMMSIDTDPDQMTIVFSNIILNGVQAMPNGGKLTISTEGNAEWVEVAISDTGVGIPPENMPKLFEPLFTTKPKGIGLGLALCKVLIDQNKGKIAVQSEVGKGTTFTITLPRSISMESQPRA